MLIKNYQNIITFFIILICSSNAFADNNFNKWLEDFKKEAFSKAAQQFQKLGQYKEPALVVGGLAAAVGTAAVAKKLFQKAEQERIKKEDPVQYEKYRRGDYTR